MTLFSAPDEPASHRTRIVLAEKDVEIEIVSVTPGRFPEDLLDLNPDHSLPTLVDRDLVLYDSRIIIEYLDRHYPGPSRLIPDDADRAWQTRLRDRFYDLYVHLPMQKIVLDRLRPDGKQDRHGVDEARAQLQASYGIIESRMADGGWAMGEAFSMADCAAFPALFYGDMAEPFGSNRGNLAAYLERLKVRPSVARVLKEAEPYFHMVPK